MRPRPQVTAARAGLFSNIGDDAGKAGRNNQYGGHPIADMPGWVSRLFGAAARGTALSWDQDLCDDGPRSSLAYSAAAVMDAVTSGATAVLAFLLYLLSNVRREAVTIPRARVMERLDRRWNNLVESLVRDLIHIILAPFALIMFIMLLRGLIQPRQRR